ncbi:hypothetical protein K490DRAFT_61832 [Saccharata proteae CBS 121410]|uniref:Uncharacterized protein n=1 Tax=Saccharata proteae CBS 121410 TaxID=1314787 RepID=A0A9P4I0X1_9PEZI|nr:hypothetical protein K490DRAFT_61832 [Saccharata proteae CBS 121410]
MAACRKRSRDQLDYDDYGYEGDRSSACNGTGAHEEHDRRPSAELKRTRTESELDALGVIPVSQAWPVEMGDWIQSASVWNDGRGLRDHVAGRSLFILCVVEHMSLQYRLLW